MHMANIASSTHNPRPLDKLSCPVHVLQWKRKRNLRLEAGGGFPQDDHLRRPVEVLRPKWSAVGTRSDTSNAIVGVCNARLGLSRSSPGAGFSDGGRRSGGGTWEERW